MKKIELIPDVAFTLSNVFTKEECQVIINNFEEMQYQHTSEVGWRNDFRNAFKKPVKNAELSRKLYERISPYLKKEFVLNEDEDPLKTGYRDDPLNYGKWQLSHFDQTHRINKYVPGGHYQAHYDGQHLKDGLSGANNRSFTTCVLYLNNDMEGGSTDILDPETNEILHAVKPETGSVLIFNHHTWHRGAVVKSGLKYIIQTVIFYERIEKHEFTKTQQEALDSLQKAIDVEVSGENLMEAIAYYKRAWRLWPKLDSANY